MSDDEKGIVVVDNGKRWTSPGEKLDDIAAELAEKVGARSRDVRISYIRTYGDHEYVLGFELICPMVEKPVEP